MVGEHQDVLAERLDRTLAAGTLSQLGWPGSGSRRRSGFGLRRGSARSTPGSMWNITEPRLVSSYGTFMNAA